MKLIKNISNNILVINHIKILPKQEITIDTNFVYGDLEKRINRLENIGLITILDLPNVPEISNDLEVPQDIKTYSETIETPKIEVFNKEETIKEEVIIKEPRKKSTKKKSTKEENKSNI